MNPICKRKMDYENLSIKTYTHRGALHPIVDGASILPPKFCSSPLLKNSTNEDITKNELKISTVCSFF